MSAAKDAAHICSLLRTEARVRIMELLKERSVCEGAHQRQTPIDAQCETVGTMRPPAGHSAAAILHTSWRPFS